MERTNSTRKRKIAAIAAITAVVAGGGDFSAYPTSAVAPIDNHPNAAGMAKATAEFVPLLNAFRARWAAWRSPGRPTACATRISTRSWMCSTVSSSCPGIRAWSTCPRS